MKTTTATIGCITGLLHLLIALPMWFYFLFWVLSLISAPTGLYVLYWAYLVVSVLLALGGNITTYFINLLKDDA